MDVSAVLRRAAPIAVAGAALTIAMQTEAVALRAPPHSSLAARVVSLAAFPFAQWPTALVATAVAIVLVAIARGKAGTAAAAGAFAVLHALIAFDATSYRLFGEHIAIGQAEGGVWLALRPLLASAFQASGVLLAINLAAVALTTWWIVPRLRAPAPRWSSRRMRLGFLIALATALIGARAANAAGASDYPLHGLFSTGEPLPPMAFTDPVPDDSLERLRDSTWRDTLAGAAAVVSARIHAAYDRPNVVLLVLESVGSEQLLPGGHFSPAVTPTLAALAGNATVFPDIYSAFPATTRAHIPLMTGGRTITWTAASDDIGRPFDGATLVSAFDRAGYRTGLFAAPDLRFGSLANFYRTMPWTRMVYYQDGRSPLGKRDEIHSWGVNEDAVRPLAVAWADSMHSAGARFFVELHTIATHYPYGTWSGDRGPAAGSDDRARYVNSLHYTDAVIGRLLADLRSRGLLRNTIVAITGDHGEAFGDLHANNLLHRGAIYEENVRNFLVLLTPELTTGFTLHRIGTHGDVMPTLTALAGATSGHDAADVPGQDLLSPAYRPRIAYFYEDVAPAETGLRDGRWKFIVHRDGSSPRLFDLATDPTERQDLAPQYPARSALYRELTARWYLQTNAGYTSRIRGWNAAAHPLPALRDAGSLSPPVLRVGHFAPGPGQVFVDVPVVAPSEQITLVEQWQSVPADVEERIVLVSPNHRVFEKTLIVAADEAMTWYVPTLGISKEIGAWSASVWVGGRRLAATSFRVSDSSVPAVKHAFDK